MKERRTFTHSAASRPASKEASFSCLIAAIEQAPVEVQESMILLDNVWSHIMTFL